MQNDKIEEQFKALGSPQKAALLLIALGQKWATEIMRLMKEEDVKKVAFWINRMSYVPQELTERVVREFYSKLTKKTSLGSSGGSEYLQTVLSGMMGESKASDFVHNLINKEEYEIFSVLKKVDPKQLAAYLQQENSQTVALMLSYLDSERISKIIASLPEEMQTEVIMKIAKLEESDPELVPRIEAVLAENLKGLALEKDVQKMGGHKMVADILNSIGAPLDKAILEQITEEDFDLATAIKDLMFVFDDILLLDDKSIQTVLKEVDNEDLVVSLKGANEEVREKIFRNISKRQVEMISDELAFMGAVKASVVQGSQTKIVNIIRRLDEEGQVLIQGKGGGGDEIFS
ncbi:MAG: flagellar motor switch protein FliG [Chlamydiales bacterium]